MNAIVQMIQFSLESFEVHEIATCPIKLQSLLKVKGIESCLELKMSSFVRNINSFVL